MGNKASNMIKTQGFTLVELSIVIIILGFLIASIAAGTSLIKQAKLSRVIQEIQTYDSSFTLFESKYGYIPGDMPNATSYWPSATNGNGDFKIATGGSFYDNIETRGAWQHLALAGMIKGAYTIGGVPSIIGQNIPGSAYSTSAGYYPESDNLWGVYDGNAVRLMLTGVDGWQTNVGGWGDPKMVVYDAAVIDQKIDNGLPGTGRFITWDGGGLCTSYKLSLLGGGAIPSNQSYVLNTNNLCDVGYGLYGYSFTGGGN